MQTYKNLFLLLGICLALSIGSVLMAAPDRVSPSDMTTADSARIQEARLWADSVAGTLNLNEQIGQLVFPRLDIKDNAEGRAALRSLIEKQHIGGFLLGKGTLADYKGLIDYAQGLSKVPLMVTLDGEWGLAMRVTDAPRFPHNMALGAVRNVSLLEEYGEEVARECREMGITVNFAPVLDVNSNPANPVIGFRSFGENPKRVAALGVAYSKGLERGGVMSVAKHFPGHGDTNVDSHKALPVVHHSKAELEATDLVPFRAYIDAGMSGIMVGHLDVPVLDKSGRPASLSKIVTSDLLKRDLGFNGLVWTDALAMKGARSGENVCVAALKAGADVLLQPLHPADDIKAVRAAVEKGELSEQTIRERCVKVLTYKRLFAPAEGGSADSVATEEAAALNRRLSEAVVTVLKNDDDLMPLQHLEGEETAIVSLGAAAANPFSRMCGQYTGGATVGSAEGTLTEGQIAKIAGADVIVVGVFKQNAAVGSSLSRLASLKGKKVCAIFLNPYKMAKMQNSIEKMQAIVSTFDDTPLLEECAAEAIFGGIGANGRLPVNLKGWMKAGTGVDTKKIRMGYSTPEAEGLPATLRSTYSNMINQAIKAGAFPGCQVVVAKNGRIVLDEAYGSMNPGGTTPVTRNTLYDIASVSKVAGVVSALMQAYDKGKFKLDDPIGMYLPYLKGTDKGGITIKELLLHRSGMPPMLSIPGVLLDTATFSKPIYKSKPDETYSIKVAKNLYANRNARLRTDIASTKRSDKFPWAVAEGIYVGPVTLDTLRARIAALPLKDKSYRYSDLNFALLAEMLTRIEKKPLDRLVEEDVFKPLGARHTMYNPLSKGVAVKDIAPTEKDNFLRRQHLRGYVHDELAAFSGGVQGNAGLFSTAGDLALLAQTWLDLGAYGGEQIFKPATVATFTNTRSQDGRRALGFDTAPAKSGKGSTASYGHLGFTGAQIKVDPENNLVFVFLSNRVNPSRDNAAFTKSDIRARLWDALFVAE